MKLSKLRWGEAVLWLLFIWFAIEAAGVELTYNGSEDPVTMAGICAVSAIAVRATREPENA
jgi:hypothetical protein